MRWPSFGLALMLIASVSGRRHHLEITDDYRAYIALSTFGFLQGGQLDVRLGQFRVPPSHENAVFGLALDRTQTDMVSPYIDQHLDTCMLTEHASPDRQKEPIVLFVMNLRQRTVAVNCSAAWPRAFIYPSSKHIAEVRERQLHDRQRLLALHPPSFESNLIPALRRRRRRRRRQIAASQCVQSPLELHAEPQTDGSTAYSMQFSVWIPTVDDEGLYNLYFHACPNYNDGRRPPTPLALNFQVDIEESNRGSFLSAGEMPLPALYFMLSILFCLSGVFWLFILCKSRHPVFKIHYIMAVLVFLKALSLLFHSINFHFIEVLGEHVETWAILFYVAHLLKGSVLFITIVLIGTGYTFIKHILSDQDKRLFVIVIPLQIVANVAQIICAEGEEADKDYVAWTHILYIVDLLCCAAILFPVVWSIRHLQEGARTDGKVATNLRKLCLFRQFYIMIVFYIYLTRIVTYLLRMTVPFQYGWLDEMFREMATYVFFVLTAYKFRPTGSHPYFAVAADDDDDDDVDDEDDGARNEGDPDAPDTCRGNAEQDAYECEKGDNLAQRKKRTEVLTRSGLIEESAAGLTRKSGGGSSSSSSSFFRHTQLVSSVDARAQPQTSEQRASVLGALDDGHLAANNDGHHAGGDADDFGRVRIVDDRTRLLANRESSHEYD